MVVNLLRESIGQVHNDRLVTAHIAIEFSPDSQSPIQVFVRRVRQRELPPPFYEVGGTFVTLLGSMTTQ